MIPRPHMKTGLKVRNRVRINPVLRGISGGFSPLFLIRNVRYPTENRRGWEIPGECWKCCGMLRMWRFLRVIAVT